MPKDNDNASKAALTFSYLPVTKQIGLLVGLAASIVLAGWVILWAKEPNFRPLYSNLDPRDAHQVTEALQSSGVKFRFDGNTGTISVEGGKFYEARMSLAAQGLPNGGGMGYELLAEQKGIGTSQFMEQARYRHALEVELGRSITSFKSVRKARVHLAVPKQSVFIRDKRNATASVLIDLYPGRSLASEQAHAIAHLVSSSVPGLNSDEVTVVDQEGRVLHEAGGMDHIALADKQLKYIKSVENNYKKQIEGILSPILGVGKVKAQVSVDIDFTHKTLARESYDPDLKVVRSEQSLEEVSQNGTRAGGVPGSLTNTPGDVKVASNEKAPGGDSVLQSTRNYELDKTVSYTEQKSGAVTRITVAVVVDNKTSINSETGEVETISLTENELSNLSNLVKGAIGYNVARGDSVQVINSSFFKPQDLEEIPEPTLWQKPETQDLAKQSVGVLLILLIIFGVLKPTLKMLSKNARYISLQASDDTGRLVMTNAHGESMAVGEDGQVMLPSIAGGAGPNSATSTKLSQLKEHDAQMKAVKELAQTDPKRVAQVVKDWIAQD